MILNDVAYYLALFKILEYVITNKLWYEILNTEKLKGNKNELYPIQKVYCA